ncbi:HAD family hydrolase [Pseudoalteromonas sp. MMG013]|uniref:HAD family hydrolase n=1 Tax=unclassified Pseudoalteromonas TaxID=194690 RepID=UPI001B38DAE0|nr:MULTISPECIES: HAD-IA family hydrolase [unclassified Pseudoalteromonas]MBQ4850378.1 HAD family hydrolase [Pseudoalteromonas sp. MMG012]MBQ4860448.1 HAD family hydrolase [Pseudoalteromonas sp. MMG013]
MAQATVQHESSSVVSSSEIKGVIFDLDGTLVSSGLDFSIIKAQVGCPHEQDLLTYIDNLPSPYMRQEAMHIVHQHELMDAQTAELLPGVRDCLEALIDMSIPMAIVTRNYTKAAELKVRHCHIPIATMITRDDAPAKPDPTALLHIAKLWHFNAKNCIYVGDYLYDIQAAHNASMRACLYAPECVPAYASEAQFVMHHFSELPRLILSTQ